MTGILIFIGLALLALIQGGLSIWASRSGNSSDPMYHLFPSLVAKFCSIGCVTVFISYAVGGYLDGDVLLLIATIATYVLGSSLGAYFTMRYLIKKEKGKQRVGSW